MSAASKAPTRRVVFALGSNLGNRFELLQGAVDALAETPGLRLVAVSPVYESDPVGGPEQPDYLNAVVLAEGAGSPRSLLARAHELENAAGRQRSVPNGPRTLDVDVIAVGDMVVDELDLQVPHPRASERSFVLVPWSTVDAEAELPGVGPVAVLAERVGETGVRRRHDLDLVIAAAGRP